MTADRVPITAEQAGLTLAALVRSLRPGLSWAQVRRLIETRHVKLNDELALDPARRLKVGDVVEISDRPAARQHLHDAVVIRHLDAHVVVVAKPAGMNTVRHPAEREWPEQRRALSPTLQDVVAKMTGGKPLRVVHRLDKETSGLVVFARSVKAERGLGRQFHDHNVQRRYRAIVPGYLPPQRIETYLMRDRGDGRRGSGPPSAGGKRAVTHIETADKIGDSGYSIIGCRLETGRTHQIRIHLAEWGHPLCGERVYNRTAEGVVTPDASGAPRLALHAAELGFTHPATTATLFWEMPLPPDLQTFVEQLRRRPASR